MAVKNKQGEWVDSRGRAVPPKYVPKIEKKRDALVEKVSKKAEEFEARMKTFKEDIFNMIEEYLEFLEKEVGGKGTEWKGNLTLTNFSGTRQVELAINEIIEFDERLNIAKAKIDNCLKRWSEDGNRNLRPIVQEAFNVDKKGRINTHLILRLTKINIADREWKEAMQLIKDSINVRGSRRYVNIRRRKSPEEQWETINLNFSSI